MKKYFALFLIFAVVVPLLFSCSNKEAYDGYVSISDGAGNDGAFLVEEKKSSYKKEDLVVLYVKNTTENEYSVTVTVSFLDADGKEAAGDMTKTKTVFSELETCYIFRTNTKFERFEYNLSAKKKDESSGGFKYGKQVTAGVGPHMVDVHEGAQDIRTIVSFPLMVHNYFSDAMDMKGSVLLFDNCGEVWGIHEFSNVVPPGQDDYNYVEFVIDGVLWEDGFKLPENLEGQLEVAYDFEYSAFDG
ncbi:MAG: hypothetical protein IJM71_07770 [Clostridia bacterium]|nr:hypothetical protein [Clostridia bacterium]